MKKLTPIPENTKKKLEKQRSVLLGKNKYHLQKYSALSTIWRNVSAGKLMKWDWEIIPEFFRIKFNAANATRSCSCS